MSDASTFHFQGEALKRFYVEGLRTLSERLFVHGKNVVPDQQIFTLTDLKRHLSNPLLQRTNFSLFHHDKLVDFAPHAYFKIVQGKQCSFLDRRPMDDYFRRGAACLLEGVDMLDSRLGRLAADVDALNPNLIMSNIVVFFSQKNNEAYRGHFDSDDVLALQLEGRKKWALYERQPMRHVDKNELPPERMGRKLDEVLMEPGDALLVKNGVPHLCQTVTDYSLHLSFDLCDRSMHPGRIVELLLQKYERASCYAYAPPQEVLQKLFDNGMNADFQAFVKDEIASYRREFANYRDKMSASEVKFFDRWLE